MLYAFSYFVPVLYDLADIILLLLGISILIDTILLFGKRYALLGDA